MPNLRLCTVILAFWCVPTGWATTDTSYSQADVETAILLRDDAMSNTRVEYCGELNDGSRTAACG